MCVGGVNFQLLNMYYLFYYVLLTICHGDYTERELLLGINGLSDDTIFPETILTLSWFVHFPLPGEVAVSFHWIVLPRWRVCFF